MVRNDMESNVIITQPDGTQIYSRSALAGKIASERIRLGTSSTRSSKLVINRRSTIKKLQTLKQDINLDDHLLSLGELELRYDTNIKIGLRNDSATRLLKQYGPNSLAQKRRRSRFVLFLEHMFLGFSAVLWIGVILTMVGFFAEYMKDPNNIPFEQLYIAIAIFTVLTITGLFGYVQENTNTNIMEGFLKMVPKTANVIRDGASQAIASDGIVIGDLIELNAGSCVPADIRIVECTSMKVDNASVTGESEPQSREVKRTDDNPLETKNLAFFGTNVVEGSGKGIVVATGDNTLMGHLAMLTSELESDETPIKKELRHFVQQLVVLAMFIGSSFFAIALTLKYTLLDAFIYFIAFCVATVPEGLLVTMTACLTLTAKKMARKNCLCKNLHAIETLGATSVICSDKTGTLTKNKMTVSHIYYGLTVYDLLSGSFVKPTEDEAYADLCRCAILCSRAEFVVSNSESVADTQYMVIKGDASEIAILRCMEKLEGGTMQYRKKYPKIFEIPFNSRNKFQISIHKLMNSDGLILVIKGAPERILDLCVTYYEDGDDQEINDKIRSQMDESLLSLSRMGERVLAFADYVMPSVFTEIYPFSEEDENFPSSGFRFLGFMSMIDPPRPGVSEAIVKCKTAGIRVVMVTGDHPITALAIAKKVGIISEHARVVFDHNIKYVFSVSAIERPEKMDAAVITGTELRSLSGRDLDRIVKKFKELVFARTSPQQKLIIVEAFQNSDEVVAVTGDGVNDSPALKKANIGVAMGISGSDVSKEAADMIILDDNFASIVIGIEEGRLIFDNLKKSIAYMLTSNIPEMVPFLVHILFSIPLPLTIMAILIVNVGTDLWPGISFAYEEAETDIMFKKPRDTHTDSLVTSTLIMYTNLNVGLMQAMAGLSCYFYVMAEFGFLPLTLIGIREEWDSDKSDVLDSYGQEWTKHERDILLKKSVSAYFCAIVITQVADCIICKTRRISLIDQGMQNWIMNTGLMFEIAVALIVVYCPYINDILGFSPIGFYAYVPAIIFGIIIIILDEIRKYMLRKSRGGWVERELYY